MSTPAAVSGPASGTAPPTRPVLRFRGREIPVVLPSRRDPRLRLSVVIITLHVLGQTLLGFRLSIAQIFVTIAVCVVVDTAVSYRREHMLVWPASAVLTGSSVAFILRAAGTQHGDWWSLNGIHWFVLAALLSLLSKYLIRPGGRHIFNPSNVGIVWCLLVIGSKYVYAQDLWWGPHQVGQVLAYAVIGVGGYWVLKRVRMVAMAASFLITFAVLVGIIAIAGGSFVALWHPDPVTGWSYWWNLAASPEVLVFVFFMISDPQTAPKVPIGRVIYGAATAAIAAGLLAFQSTEFGVKLAILASLTLVCALVPFLDKALLRRQPAALERLPQREPLTRLRTLASRPAIVATAIVALAAPVDTLRLIGNDQLAAIETGQTGVRPPQ